MYAANEKLDDDADKETDDERYGWSGTLQKVIWKNWERTSKTKIFGSGFTTKKIAPIVNWVSGVTLNWIDVLNCLKF